MESSARHSYLLNLLILLFIAIHGLFLRYLKFHFGDTYQFLDNQTWDYLIFQIATMAVFLSPLYVFANKLEKLSQEHTKLFQKIDSICAYIFWIGISLLLIWVIISGKLT